MPVTNDDLAAILRAILKTLDTQSEMLRKLMQLATEPADGGSDLTKALIDLKTIGMRDLDLSVAMAKKMGVEI